MENRSVETDFFDWLSKQVSPTQLSDLYTVFSGINEYCLSRKILKTPLFNTTDIAILSKVRSTVQSDKVFAFQYKKQRKQMIQGMYHYVRFIKEAFPNGRVAESTVQEPPKQVIATVVTQAPVETEAAPIDLDVLARDNRSKFIEWMEKTGIDSSSLLMHPLYVKKCGDFAEKADYISKNIFAVSSYEEVAKIQKLLEADSIFTALNSGCKNHLTESLALFTDFLISKQGKTTAGKPNGNTYAPSDGNGSVVEDADLISEVLSDEAFESLRVELSRQGIITVGDLKQIKLWQFMNRYNLYSIAIRQSIFDRVQGILKSQISIDPSQRYKLIAGESEYYGDSPAEAYLSFCENLARKYPLRIRGLIGKKNSTDGTIALHKTDDTGAFLKLANPVAFIENDLSSAEVIANVRILVLACTNKAPAISVKEPEPIKANPVPEPTGTHPDVGNNPKTDGGASGAPGDNPNKFTLSPHDKKMVERAEKIVLEADIDGISYDDLRDELNTTATETKKIVPISTKIVEINNKLYHEDAIIDWDEGADCLDSIMDKLMQKNSGYVSSSQLFDYARIEMNMFLNDNDFNDERAVFDIVQHLFSKTMYHGKRYTFVGKMHISKSSETIGSNFDVFCKFAADQGGVFKYSDLVEYLSSVGIGTGNLRSQLKVHTEPNFLYIDEGVLITAKSMQIDATWKNTVKKAIKKLFDDVGDHIILREILPVWFDQLPKLPAGWSWTPLLLQSVLRFFGEEFGARTIIAMGSQGIDTLHTMLVSEDSQIQNFGDVVICYLLENEITSRRFEAEELRGMLINSKMIQGNELIYNMPKALGNDERFAWDAGGDFVTIKV